MIKKSNPLRWLTTFALATAALSAPAILLAQGYPTKPITLVVPNPPGGFVDASARILSDSLAKVTSQAVVVDNRSGGSATWLIRELPKPTRMATPC